jgi:hypothetical protein
MLKKKAAVNMSPRTFASKRNSPSALISPAGDKTLIPPGIKLTEEEKGLITPK